MSRSLSNRAIAVLAVLLAVLVLAITFWLQPSYWDRSGTEVSGRTEALGAGSDRMDQAPAGQDGSTDISRLPTHPAEKPTQGNPVRADSGDNGLGPLNEEEREFVLRYVPGAAETARERLDDLEKRHSGEPDSWQRVQEASLFRQNALWRAVHRAIETGTHHTVYENPPRVEVSDSVYEQKFPITPGPGRRGRGVIFRFTAETAPEFFAARDYEEAMKTAHARERSAQFNQMPFEQRKKAYEAYREQLRDGGRTQAHRRLFPLNVRVDPQSYLTLQLHGFVPRSPRIEHFLEPIALSIGDRIRGPKSPQVKSARTIVTRVTKT